MKTFCVATQSLFLLALSLSLVGCGGADDGPALHSVTGTINIDGSPLPTGSVTFDPSGSGQPAMGGIENGKFTAEVASGEYIVRVASMESTGTKDEYGEEEVVSIIGDEFNANSTLKASIKEGDNSLSFDVKRKK